jgi:hypothetical protein
LHGSRSITPLGATRGAGNSFVHSTAFEVFSRAGFVARALVYAIIGVLALEVATGTGGKLTNQQGALRTVANQPFGKVLLTVLAIGLGGYAAWRLIRAAIGHGPEASDNGFERIAGFASGIAYAAMCAVAIGILAGAAQQGQSGSPKKTTADVFGWPGGTWIVGIAGIVVVGIGLYQAYRGLTKQFLKDSKVEEMGASIKRWFGRIGLIGHLARGVVFGLVGTFLIKAAVDYKPHDAVGLDGALAKLAHRSYGPLALGVVAAGLIAFALYSLSDARYHRI